MVDTVEDQPWVPTHRAPPEGMDAWANPDGSAPPGNDLAAGVELQVIGEAGVWARVRGENGWEGWVDGRLLEQVETSGRNPDLKAYVLLGIAVVVLVVLAVLSVTGGSS